MVHAVESFQERIIRTIEQALKEEGHTNTEDDDFGSVSMSLNQIISEPIFNVGIQLLPETVRLKAKPLRVTIRIAINRNAGLSPHEQGLKVSKTADQISDWIDARAYSRLNGRNFRLINQDTQTAGLLVIALLQFECIVFMKKGEY